MTTLCRLALLTLLLLPGLAAAQPAAIGAADRAAIRDVIERQIDAFRRDAGDEAFAYASPGIRATFATPDVFLDMVRSAYSAVYRPRAVRFEAIVDFHGRPAQRVHLVGADGIPVIALYPMERQPDGQWLIAGCFLIPTEERII